MSAQTLCIGGFVPLSTLDYPEHLSAVVFCQGCPWKCRYCHNKALIPPASSLHQWDSIQRFLLTRQGLLDAVVFSGGEPTLQKSLLNAIQEVKALGFKVALHTSGSYPTRLEEILPYVDWVGLDVKALPEDYPQITNVPRSGERAWKSLQLLLTQEIPFECRTTVHCDLLDAQKVRTLGNKLATFGVSHYALQMCRTDNCLDPKLAPHEMPFSMKQELLAELSPLFTHFQIRE